MSAPQLLLTALIAGGLLAAIVRCGESLAGSRVALIALGVVLAAPVAFLFTGAMFGTGSVTPPAHGVTLPLTASPDSVASGPCFAQSEPAPGGRSGRLHIVPGWVRGEVEHSFITRRSAQFCGWSISAGAGHAADEVVVVVNGRIVGSIKPTISRPDVARVVGGAGENSGFSIHLPLRAFVAGNGRPRVQLLGVERGMASVLPFLCTSSPNVFGC